jgi:hypothetical protein
MNFEVRIANFTLLPPTVFGVRYYVAAVYAFQNLSKCMLNHRGVHHLIQQHRN